MKNTRLKKISAFIPANLLEKAQAALDLNQTDTLIAGLREVIARNERIRALKALPKISIDYDVGSVRQRRIMRTGHGYR